VYGLLVYGQLVYGQLVYGLAGVSVKNRCLKLMCLDGNVFKGEQRELGLPSLYEQVYASLY
jgi:hypothetical protein